MKKLTSLLAFFFFTLVSVFCAEPFATYTLSNGLTVFIKEDSSVAVTTIELAVKAGNMMTEKAMSNVNGENIETDNIIFKYCEVHVEPTPAN